MSLWQLCGIALICAVLGLSLKSSGASAFVPLVTVGGSLLLVFALLSRYGTALSEIFALFSDSPAADSFLLVCKAMGVAFLCSTTADICRDMGEASLGARVEAIGRMEILLLCLPTFSALLQAALALGGGA